MSFLALLNTKEDILIKNVGNQIVDGIHWLLRTIKANGYRQLFVPTILQNIFFCVQQMKHTGL